MLSANGVIGHLCPGNGPMKLEFDPVTDVAYFDIAAVQSAREPYVLVISKCVAMKSWNKSWLMA